MSRTANSGTGPAGITNCRQSLYFPKEHIEALLKLAGERERSLSYLAGQALAFWLSKGAPDVTRTSGEVK